MRTTRAELADQRRFLAMVSHDLRSPLQTVSVALGLIAADAAPGMEKPLRLARSSLLRTSALLADLLELSLLTRGQALPLRRERVRLQDLVMRAVDDAQLRFPGRHVAFDASAESDWADLDVMHMAQVLDNLISNALIHSPGHSSVVLRMACEPGGLKLEVENRGGIDARVQARMFQPMNRGEGSVHPGSMGLGLYIVKRLVEAHAGRVEAYSDAESTRFSVFLPRADGV